MNWLLDAFWARIGWALGEAVIILIALTAILICALALYLPTAWRQSRCKHTRYRETSACDAICNDCGRNLGFIGSWRDKTTPAVTE